MEQYLNTLLFAFLAYLVGSFSTAILTCKIMRIEDPRTTGSNNPGATNVLRHGGKKAAIITLLGDMLKGLIPVLLAKHFQLDDLTVALVGLFALLGHIFPVYYGFKGGKGVATFYGVILAMNWMVGLIALAIWISMAAIVRISSLSALVSVYCTPLILAYFTHSIELTSALTLMGVFVFWRHKKNILSLLAGTEVKIGERPK